MDGRAFLDVADRVARGATEADWRTAAGRAYSGLLQEAASTLRRWGFAPSRRDPLHAFVRLRFVYAKSVDLMKFGYALDQLVRLRNAADSRLDVQPPFETDISARQALDDARKAVALLDAIEADPARRMAAIAAIRAGSP